MRNSRTVMNDELERMQKKAVMPRFEAISHNLHGWGEEKFKNHRL
jgi:hypothetical protein